MRPLLRTLLWLLVTLVSHSALAQPTAPKAEADAAAKPENPEFLKHFNLGVKLYQDGNYPGALAEFEAAYRIERRPSALQNIALSLKALFRYAEAEDMLKLLLERHAAELSDEQKATVKATLEELSQLYGSVVLAVTPIDARVTLDGRLIEKKERDKPVRLNVGEHRVTAEAPGFTKYDRILRIAGGPEIQRREIKLEANMGFVEVKTNDPDAAIAVDSSGAAFHRYRGPVTPGTHYVQVYKKGFKTYEKQFQVAVGETHTIDVPALVKDDDDSTPETPAGPPSPQRGWYALFAASGLSIDNAPRNIDIESTDERAGYSVGARAGYRIWSPVAVELLLEGGRHLVKDACDEANSESLEGKCDNPQAVKRTYTLESFRLGGNVRLMSGGEKLRFTSTLGVGGVRHKLKLDPSTDPAGNELKGGTAQGIDPYFLLEIGMMFNFGHIIVEGDLLAFVEGASSIRGNLDGSGDQAIFESGGGLRMIGLGLRGGWGEWSPSK